MPSMPAYTDADDTPGVQRTIGITCCTTASVRARLVPGGIVIDIETLFWSCAGMKPRGVSSTRQAGERQQARIQDQQQRAAIQQRTG